MNDDIYKIKAVIFSDERRLISGDRSYITTVIFENGRVSTVRRKKGEKNDIELGVLYAYYQGCTNLSKIKARSVLLDWCVDFEIKGWLYWFFADKNNMNIDEAEKYIKSLLVE